MSKKEPWQMTKDESRQAWEENTKAGKKRIPTPQGFYKLRTDTSEDEALYKLAYDYWLNALENIKEGEIVAQTDLYHLWSILQALNDGERVPLKVLMEYPHFKPLKPPSPVQTPMEKIVARRDKMRKHYQVLFGVRITLGTLNPITYELVDVNDVGIPYWAKVVRGKRQKSLVTMGNYSRDWLDEELAKIKRRSKRKPLPPDAISPQTLPFNSKAATCYGKRTKRGSFRVYCRIKKG